MGWRYKYVLMPPDFDINAVRSAACKAGFQDFTDLAEASNKWESEKIAAMGAARKDRTEHNYTKEELEAKSKAFMEFFTKEPEDEALRRYRDAELSQDLTLYQIWFNRIGDRHVMFYTSFGYDLNADFITIAMSQLCKFGVRGRVWVVSGNSVVDEVSAREYDIKDGNFFHIEALEEAGSRGGDYKAFLSGFKGAGADLSEIHEALLEEVPGHRLPTTMLGMYLEGNDDQERYSKLVAPTIDMLENAEKATEA